MVFASGKRRSLLQVHVSYVAVDLIKLLKIVKEVYNVCWRKSIEAFVNLQEFIVVSLTLL